MKWVKSIQTAGYKDARTVQLFSIFPLVPQYEIKFQKILKPVFAENFNWRIPSFLIFQTWHPFLHILCLQPQISIVFLNCQNNFLTVGPINFVNKIPQNFFNNSSLNPRFPVKLYAFQIFAIFRTLLLEQIEMWTQRGTTAAKDALCLEGREKNILAFFITSCAHN